ncbi:MAG TPA: VanZ family protein [Rubricoccaceae bacterium]|jgi:VanZ family protein
MRRFIAVAWTAGLFASTLAPGEYVPSVPLLSFDKVVHVALFFGFAMLWLALYPARRRAVMLGGLTVGVAVEVLQHTLPIHRSGDAFDVLADAVGLALAFGAHVWLRGSRAAPATDATGSD